MEKAFGIQMIDEIANKLNEIGCPLENFYIVDIKEKYGCLRFCCLLINFNCRSEIDDIIRKYENISERTCISCGKPATRRSTGWISPWCDSCAKDINDNFIDIR